MAFIFVGTDDEDVIGFEKIEHTMTFQGYRRYVAFAYIGVNAIGFAVNFWMLYIVAPLLFSSSVKVPKSILFYIMTLCISDLMIMIGMLFLITEIVLGTWRFSAFACVTYLVFEAMNKFVAPVIVVLISRTCYVTVCLGVKRQEKAASLKYAMCQAFAAMAMIMIVLSPVFAYSQVTSVYFNANETMRTVRVMRKCSFQPPSGIELAFGVISCIASYAIPLGGMIYWYVSVPFFLKKRAEKSLVCSSSSEAAMRKVIATVLVLTLVYVSCWSPYWLNIFAHKFIKDMSRGIVIASYLVHLLPYISCSAYPVIFTLMNRSIKIAHAQLLESNKRRLRSLASDDLPHRLRPARISLPALSNNVFAIKQRLHSITRLERHSSHHSEDHSTFSKESAEKTKSQSIDNGLSSELSATSFPSTSDGGHMAKSPSNDDSRRVEQLPFTGEADDGDALL